MKKNLSRKSSNSAFTLIEMVIVLFLTGLILGAVSILVARTFDSLKFLEEKSRTLESATLGCERLASELREAVELVSGLPSNELRFKKVKPSAPKAVGNEPMPPPLTALDDPADYVEPDILPVDWIRSYSAPTNHLFEVHYWVDSNDHLQRKAGNETAIVATDVNEFMVSPLTGTSSFLVALSIQEQRRVVVFETVVNCPGLEKGYEPN